MMSSKLAETGPVAQLWSAVRPAGRAAHFDVARCSVTSDGVIAAIVEHLSREQALGGYQAETELKPMLDRSRVLIDQLLGGGELIVEFLPNGTDAMRLLLESWPLSTGAIIGVPRSEFASNRMTVERLAKSRSLSIRELAEDDEGRIDLGDATRTLAKGLDLIVLSHIPSQRGVVQPAGMLIELAREQGADVILDVCQSAGHVPVPAGAAAYAGTSRKWLSGPRGAAFIAVKPTSWRRLDGPVTLQTHRHQAQGSIGRLHGVPAIEAAIAIRAGFAQALVELDEIGLPLITSRLITLGQTIRAAVSELKSWRLREPLDEPSALVTLEPIGSYNAREAIRALAVAGITAGIVPAGRALDHEHDVLRLSPDPGAQLADIDLLQSTLGSNGVPVRLR